MTLRANRGASACSSSLAWAFHLLLAACAGAAEPNSSSARRLFNGTHLNNWTTWLVDTRHADPRHVFTVTNGWIHISGDGLGYLATTNEFHDYKLTVEFKWGRTNTTWGDRIGHARDSGVFLHATGADGNSYDGRGAFMAAIECNIFEGATGDFLLIRGTNGSGQLVAPRVSFHGSARRDTDGFRWFEPRGDVRSLERWGRVNWNGKSDRWRDEFGFRGSRDVEKRVGEWNQLEINCETARIRVKLNGALVNEAFDVFPSSGKILLQCEGSEIFFRRVEIEPLPGTGERPR